MKVIAVLLIIIGLGGIAMGAMMFGDIGIAALIGGLVGSLSGLGFWIVGKRLKQ